MKRTIIMGVIPLALAGCATTSDLTAEDFLAERQPVSPTEEISKNTYRTVLSGYHPRTVVEPQPWGKQNANEEKNQ